MIHFITNKRLEIIRRRAWEEGLRKGWELCKGMESGKGIIISALNPQFRQDIEDILKGKRV
jgi:hypothetical protein